MDYGIGGLAQRPRTGMSLNAAIGLEQRRREDAKKRVKKRPLRGRLDFPRRVKPSGLGERVGFALFSIFASSRLRCSTAASRMTGGHEDTRKRVFIRTVQQINGWQDRPQTFSARVPPA